MIEYAIYYGVGALMVAVIFVMAMAIEAASNGNQRTDWLKFFLAVIFWPFTIIYIITHLIASVVAGR